MSNSKAIKKAVLPVAGLGTRFLPASKAIPKEMLPIVDTPLVEFAVREAVEAGIEEIIFITSHTKRPIEDHFKRNEELETQLLSSDKKDYIDRINLKEYEGVKFSFIRLKFISAPSDLPIQFFCIVFTFSGHSFKLSNSARSSFEYLLVFKNH